MNLDCELFEAAGEGATWAVIALLKLGADVNAKDQDGQTPLHLAAAGGHRETALALMKRGASLSHRDNWGRAAWKKAMDNGHAETADAIREEIALRRQLRAELRSITKQRES